MRLLIPFITLAALLGASMLLGGGEKRADLAIAHAHEVFTLDPQRMSYQHEIRVGKALFEGLVTLNEDDCTIRPAAASRWEQTEDGLGYRFHLREDGRWSNGDPVTADDFVHAWRRALLPETAADYSGLLLHLDGAQAFFEWRAEQLASFDAHQCTADALWQETLDRFDRTVGVRAIDPHTLEVRLRAPVAYFLDLLSFPVFFPVHRATHEQSMRLDPATGRVVESAGWTRPGVLASNGPYRLEQWRYKRDMRLEPNTYFRPSEAPACASVSIRPIEDANTAVLAFEAGVIDWIPDLLADYRPDMVGQRRQYETAHASAIEEGVNAGESLDEVVRRLPPARRDRGERRDVRVFDAFGTDFYSFNCRPRLGDGRPNPFADARVRRAFALAVDKATLVSSVTRLHEHISGSLVPAGSIAGYTPPAGLGFDPQLARETLAAAGWSDRDGDGLVESADGQRFATVDLLYSTGNPRYRDLSLALRDMWRRTLGVEVELRGKEGRFFKDDLRSGNFMVARGGWYGDYGDPTTFLELSRTGDGNNDRGYANPAFDALLDAAERAPDAQRRLEILAEAERLLVEEDLPILPLCTYVTVMMYDPARLQGLTAHPRLEQYVGRLRLAARGKSHLGDERASRPSAASPRFRGISFNTAASRLLASVAPASFSLSKHFRHGLLVDPENGLPAGDERETGAAPPPGETTG